MIIERQFQSDPTFNPSRVLSSLTSLGIIENLTIFGSTVSMHMQCDLHKAVCQWPSTLSSHAAVRDNLAAAGWFKLPVARYIIQICFSLTAATFSVMCSVRDIWISCDQDIIPSTGRYRRSCYVGLFACNFLKLTGHVRCSHRYSADGPTLSSDLVGCRNSPGLLSL